MPNASNFDKSFDKDYEASLLKNLEFADNMEARCACVLLLDNSGSMSGDRIKALNESLYALHSDLLAAPLARKRVELAIITFGEEVQVRQDFATVDDFEPPTLNSEGLTPMGGGILRALDLLDVRKAKFKAAGIQYYRPWIFLITDGEPQGEPDHVIKQASQRLKESEKKGRVAFFAVGVEGANMARLAQISARPPLKLQGLSFREMFLWLSESLKSVSQSKVGDQVALPPLTWGTV